MCVLCLSGIRGDTFWREDVKPARRIEFTPFVENVGDLNSVNDTDISPYCLFVCVTEDRILPQKLYYRSYLTENTPLVHYNVMRRITKFRSTTARIYQCFSTAGPRPGTGPWHQLYRTARGYPGICHFSFLSSFH